MHEYPHRILRLYYPRTDGLLALFFPQHTKRHQDKDYFPSCPWIVEYCKAKEVTLQRFPVPYVPTCAIPEFLFPLQNCTGQEEDIWCQRWLCASMTPCAILCAYASNLSVNAVKLYCLHHNLITNKRGSFGIINMFSDH